MGSLPPPNAGALPKPVELEVFAERWVDRRLLANLPGYTVDRRSALSFAGARLSFKIITDQRGDHLVERLAIIVCLLNEAIKLGLTEPNANQIVSHGGHSLKRGCGSPTSVDRVRAERVRLRESDGDRRRAAEFFLAGHV